MARLGATLAAPLGGAVVYPVGLDELLYPGPACPAAIGLLISPFDNAEVMQAVLCSFASRLDGLEASALQVHYSRWLDTGEGAQLDIIGKIVGELRNGLDDDAYLRGLRSRTLVNKSSGKIEQILEIADVFEPGLDSIEARELYPHSITFYALGTTEADPRALALRLRQASGGGVGLQTIHTPLGDAALHMISADTTLGTSATQGFGSTTEVTGGGLAGVIGQE